MSKTLLPLALLMIPWLAAPHPISAQAKKAPSAKAVVVSTVKAVFETPTFKANGLLTPLNKALLSVEVAGRVIKIHKRAGEFVKKGALLAVLANIDLDLNLIVLRARLREVEAELALGRQKRNRAQALFQQKLASAEQFENETASMGVVEARVESVKAQVARLEKQRKLMSVRAPVSGQIVRADLEMGKWITTNQPIYEIFNYDFFELKVGVPGRFLNKVPQSASVKLNIPEIGKFLNGKIVAVVRHVEEDSGNFRLRIEAENPSRTALSGLMALVNIPVGSAGTVLTVPRDAIIRKQGKTQVVVVREGKAHVVPIVIRGNMGGNSVIVAGGLKPNELVVVRGNERLRPGAPVKVQSKM